MYVKFQSCKFRITHKLTVDGIALHNSRGYVKQTRRKSMRTCNSHAVQSSRRLTAKAASECIPNAPHAGILSGPKSNSVNKSIKGEISDYHSGICKD